MPIRHFLICLNPKTISAKYRKQKNSPRPSNMLIAFWDGKSKGTKNMIDLATQADLKVKVICF